MKTAKWTAIILLIVFLISMPVAANAHGGFGGGVLLGLGAGLITGFAFAPRPVYVAPPVYYAPPPPVVYPSPSYTLTPVPPDPTSYEFNNAGISSSAAPSPGQPGCREWRLVNRHWERRWDGYYGRWQNVLVERWGWVGVPCSQ